MWSCELKLNKFNVWELEKNFTKQVIDKDYFFKQLENCLNREKLTQFLIQNFDQ